MGNQMPTRCMVPCNPVCCVNCFAGDTGLQNDGEHKTGSIFANSNSVLSMAAEEISLDDHLEKELANEVELWRMETSSTVVHTKDDAYRTVFAPNGREGRGGHSVDSSSAISSPTGGNESDFDDIPESLGESNGRERGKSHGECSHSGGPRRAAPGTRESTGLSTQSSLTGMRQTTPVLAPWEQAATSSLPTGASGNVEYSGPIEGLHAHNANAANAVNQQLPQSAKIGDCPAASPRLEELYGTQPPPRANTLGTLPSAYGEEIGLARANTIGVTDSEEVRDRPVAAPDSECLPNVLLEPTIHTQREPISHAVLLSHRSLLSGFDGRSNTAPASIASAMDAARDNEIGMQGMPPPDDVVPPELQPQRVPADAPPREDMQTESSLPNETFSETSSEEDSFVGFIEDPLEKQMQAPAADDILLNYRGPASAVGLELDDRRGREPTNPNQQVAIEPAPKASLAILEGVRPDRSAF